MLYVMLSVVGAGILVLLGVKWAESLDAKDAIIRGLEQELVETRLELAELASAKRLEVELLDGARREIHESYVTYMSDLVVIANSETPTTTARQLLRLRRK